MTLQHTQRRLLLTVLFFLIVPLTGGAKTTVSNIISVSANSGGQNATEGEVVTGETHTSADIVTRVNGETVESIHHQTATSTIVISETVVSDKKHSSTNVIVTTEGKANNAENNTDGVKHNTEIALTTHGNSNSLQQTQNTQNPAWEPPKQFFILSTLFTSLTNTMAYVYASIRTSLSQ